MKSKLLLTALLLSAAAAGAQVATPTMGWSSWNTFAVHISEDIIKGQADAMVKQGLKDVGYEYINIDDGFQYGRTDDGKVRIHPQRFPNGLLVVSDYIHSKGLKAGIYSDAGDCTCGSLGSGDVQNTNVGFYGHEQADANFYFIENKFDFIKVDYCGGTHLGLNEKEQYSKISQAIKNTGKDVRYNLCRWAYPGTWCSDVSTSWRTTGDIYNGWESIRDIIAENLYLSAYCRNGAYNDMDMLEVGRSLSPEEDRTHFGMWCIMASPLLIGCNMATIKPAALELLKNKELIALNQDPLGLQAYVVQHSGDTYVLAKDILNLHGTTRAVALYNPSDKESTITITASELDLAGKATVRNLVSHEDIMKNEVFTAITMTVPAHATRFLRIDAERRLDRYVYEAETAYLSEYQEIYNNESAGTAIYLSAASANGGKYAGWLGNRASNDIQWQDVYVEKGGEYVLHFNVAAQDSRSFIVNVNGVDKGTITAHTDGWEAFKEYDMTVSLKAGSNIIRLYNGSEWMPNIDCMTIEKAGSNAIINRRLSEYAARLKEAAETTGLKNKADALIARSTSKMTVDGKKALINEMSALMDVIVKVGNVCTDFAKWKTNAQQNISRIADSEILTTFAEKIPATEAAIDAADNIATANRALTDFKTAYKAFLKNSDVKPMEGQALDMTYLITDFDFSVGDGWSDQPYYRSGCGQEYDKTFDMSQTLTDMKPGVYTIRCNAFYRIGDNDGGAAYKAGTEVIPAVFYANDKSTKMKSLYSEVWQEEAEYSGMDNLNGYPHSMHAAALRFGEGCYENSVELKLDAKSNIKIGVRCNEKKSHSWCCFDNFSIEYKALH